MKKKSESSSQQTINFLKNRKSDSSNDKTTPRNQSIPFIRFTLLYWSKETLEIFFDIDSFKICADSGASSCVTPDEIDFIIGTYKYLTGVKINGIAEGIKVAGCGSVSWIFQDDKKQDIELIIEWVLHIPGLPTWLISSQQVAKKTGHIGDVLHAEKDESHLTFEGFKFITKYNSHSGLPVCNYVNGISTFKAYNIDIIKMAGKQIILHWHNDLF